LAQHDLIIVLGSFDSLQIYKYKLLIRSVFFRTVVLRSSRALSPKCISEKVTTILEANEINNSND
jgi:hypothetical protein